MKIKECPARVKATGDEGSGQFSAIVSVFGNKDSVGDVVMPGAFTDTLAEWATSGNPIPVIWSHDWGDPFSHIGYSLHAEELQPGDERLPDDIKANGGLLIDGQYDIDTNPKAAQVYRLNKGGRVTQFSFAYDVEEGAWVEQTDGGETSSHYELRKLKLYEVGPTLVGANQETELLAIKAAALAAGAKEGRVLAAKHVSKLKDAAAALTEVIAAAEAADESKTSPPNSGKDAAPASTEQDASRPGSEQHAAADEAAAAAGKSGAAIGPSPARVRINAELALCEIGAP